MNIDEIQRLLGEGKGTEAQELFNSLYETNKNKLAELIIKSKDITLLNLLVNKGLDIEYYFQGSYGCVFYLSARFGNAEMVDFLISKGADVNRTSKYGYTPFHTAAMNGSLDAAKLLISNGADVNSIDECGETPLSYAASGGSFEVAELLISKGADVNSVSEDGCTPLHIAAWKGHLDVAKLLISNGADVNSVSRSGETLLDFALTQGKLQLLKLLLEYGCDVPDALLANPIIISSLNELVGSIEASIFEKNVFTKEDIISLKFLRKYATREDVKAKFGPLLEEPILARLLSIDGQLLTKDQNSLTTEDLKNLKFLSNNIHFSIVKQYIGDSFRDSKNFKLIKVLEETGFTEDSAEIYLGTIQKILGKATISACTKPEIDLAKKIIDQIRIMGLGVDLPEFDNNFRSSIFKVFTLNDIDQIIAGKATAEVFKAKTDGLEFSDTGYIDIIALLNSLAKLNSILEKSGPVVADELKATLPADYFFASFNYDFSSESDFLEYLSVILGVENSREFAENYDFVMHHLHPDDIAEPMEVALAGEGFGGASAGAAAGAGSWE